MIKWNKEIHSVGNEETDKEHMGLFIILDELYEKFNTNQENIDKQLLKLTLYTKKHFEHEIEYYKEHCSNIDEIENHINQHNAFVSKLMSKINEDLDGKVSTTIEVIILINNWISNHIINQDKKMFNLINKD